MSVYKSGREAPGRDKARVWCLRNERSYIEGCRGEGSMRQTARGVRALRETVWAQSCSFQHKGRIKRDIFLASRVKSRLWTDIEDSFTFTRPSLDSMEAGDE